MYAPPDAGVGHHEAGGQAGGQRGRIRIAGQGTDRLKEFGRSDAVKSAVCPEVITVENGYCDISAYDKN